ncbi:MAG: hypothetical protein EOO74_10230, partial [Myxococcales bacterium]
MHPSLRLLLPLALAGSIVLVRPSGQVADAEGCSGSGDWPRTCWATSTAAVTWDMSNQGVPTDAPLRFALEESSPQCVAMSSEAGDAVAATLQIEVLDAANHVVDGTPASLVSRQTTAYGGQQRFLHEWRPAQPLTPSSAYTLRLAGVGTDGVTLLTFTTGAGPFALPALPTPTATAVTYPVEQHLICCSSEPYDCQPNPPCRPLLETTSVRALLAGTPLPAGHDALAPHLTVSVERSEAGGPYEFDNGSRLDLLLADSPHHLASSFKGTTGPFCARLRYTSDLDGASVTSAPTCLDTSALDLTPETLHCENAEGSGGGCQGGYVKSPETTQFQ